MCQILPLAHARPTMPCIRSSAEGLHFSAFHYGCSKLLKARAVFYWGTHTRFTVSVGLDPSLTKRRRARSADCISMEKRARISPLWEIVYYSDTCIVYLAVRETEYFTEILRNMPRMREQWCPGRFFPPPQKTAWERGYSAPCANSAMQRARPADHAHAITRHSC